ncbi:MAG: arylsulfatase [Puniceicoccaceae bacterium]
MLASAGQYPNILLLYLDDMGYGDLSCTNPESKIQTPNIDRLATQGVLFTDAHTPAAVCGPSRYGLLTGRYPWRRGEGGMGNGPKFRDTFIEEGRHTLASLLKRKGYNTAEMGKWGLRHNYSEAVLPGKEPGNIEDYDFENKKLLGAQLFGFDYTWTLAFLDRDGLGDKILFENSKPADPELSPLDPHRWLPGSAEAVLEYLNAYAGKSSNSKFGINPDSPFFIYWDPPSPHLPYVPNEKFTGKTEAGIYGDFMFEIDYYVGQILEALESLNLAENTIVIFSSDNGPDKLTYQRLEEFGHDSIGTWRGIKTNAFEGGHRLPLIVRWPGVVHHNRKSSALVSMTDWFATIAEITGQDVPTDAGEDSISFLKLLRNSKASPHRESAIHHSTRGVFVARKGKWVFVDSPNPPPNEPDWFRELRGIELSHQPGQLYNLEEDPAQTNNLYGEHPEKVRELKQLLANPQGERNHF